MTVQIVQHVGMDEEKIAHVYRGALLHDIGKLSIPDNILLKPSPTGSTIVALPILLNKFSFA